MLASSIDIDKPGLLVVDDEVNVTRSLARSLRDQFTVYTANSASDAIQIVNDCEIKVVLVDQRMPDMTGVELLKEIHRIRPEINSILLSGYSDVKALVDALNLGSVRGFISKPWDIHTLRKKLLETVEIFEHLMVAKAEGQGQPDPINRQDLDELKSFLGAINTIHLGVPISPELQQIVTNPFAESMSDYEYMNQLPDGFALIQPKGRIIFSNPALRRLIPIKKNLLTETLTIEDLKELPGVYEAICQSLTGSYSRLDAQVTSASGKAQYLDLSVTPVLDHEGQYRAVLVVHDQTEKEKTISYLKGLNKVALALNESREFTLGLEAALLAIKNTFNVDAVATFFLEADGKTVVFQCGVGFDEAALAYLKGAQAASRNVWQKLPAETGAALAIPAAGPDTLPIFSELAAHQSIASAAFAAHYEKNVLLGILAIYSQSPRSFAEDLLLLSAIHNQIGIARQNARLQEEAEEKVRRLNDSLQARVEERTRELQAIQEKLVRQEKLAALGQMAGGISHELRNPLGVMRNIVYLLKLLLPNPDAKVSAYLGALEKEIQTSQKIITDLLDWTRLKNVQRQPTSVGDLVETTLQGLSVPAGVEVVLKLAPDLPLLNVDPQHIVQALANLTTNACQAMPQGGRLTIASDELSSTGVGCMVCIRVQDTGVGIAPENLEKLFEPLFTTKTHGIGMGLSICRNLVEANSGRIEVQSELGRGTVFSLHLPAG